MTQRIKVATVGLLALLVLIVVLQNTVAVETKILFFTITMPRAALLFGALVTGFIAGVLAGGRLSERLKAGAKTDSSQSDH